MNVNRAKQKFIGIVRKDNLLPLLLIVIMHLAFFILALNFKGIYSGDSPEYLNAADNISKHGISYTGSFSNQIDPALYSYRTPGYPLFIAFCKTIYPSDYTVLIIQNICSIIFLWIICLKLQKAAVFQKYKWMVIAGLFFFPVYLIMVNMVLADALLGFILIAGWLLLIKFIATKNWHFLLLYNIALSCAALTKPVMMYFWVPNLAFSIYLIWKYKKIYPVFMAMILALTIGAWSYRNYLWTGYFHYSSIKMQNLLELNAGSILSYKYDNNYMRAHWRATYARSDSLATYKEKSEFLLNEAQKVIMQNPILYTKMHAKGMFNFMLAPGRIDVETFFNLDTSKPVSLLYEINKKGLFNGIIFYLKNVNILLILMVFLIAIWNVISLSLLLASFYSNKIEILQKIFLFLLILYIVFACGPGGYARFKTSIYPFVLYLIPFGVPVISDGLKKLLCGRY